jgi:iron complex transport system permease protein
MTAHPFATESSRRRRAVLVMTAALILIAAVCVISINTGHIRLSPAVVAKTLFGLGTDREELILFEFRLPRIVISILVGAALAVSGCILQGITRNALADPGILGINAGAGLMVMLFVAYGSTSTLSTLFMLPVFALLGAGGAAALIFALAYRRHDGVSPTGLVLTGIAVALGLNAAIIVLTLRLSPEQYQFAATWMAGTIWGTNWKFVLAMLPWVAVLLPYALLKARTLNVMNLGEQTSAGLGVPVQRERFKLLAVAVGLAGSSVAVAGGIAFVGLIGPHLARRLVGPQHHYLLPASALLGGLLLVTADTVSRLLAHPTEIPTGIVVAVIGAPYFIYLLMKTRD